MNELETNLAELVKKSIEVAEKTGEFVVDQAPLLIKEFYTWHIVSSIFFIGIGIFIWILCKVISNKLKGAKESFEYVEYEGRSYEETAVSKLRGGRYYKKDDESFMGVIIFKYIGLVVISIMIPVNLYTVLFIAISPKLYLLEYFVK